MNFNEATDSALSFILYMKKLDLYLRSDYT